MEQPPNNSIGFTPEGLVSVMAACGHSITVERAAMAIERSQAERTTPERLQLEAAMRQAIEDGKKDCREINQG